MATTDTALTGLASSCVTSSGTASSDITTSAIASSDFAPSDITTSGITISDITIQDIAVADTKYTYSYDFPIGRVYIAATGSVITDVAFHPVADAVDTEKETPLIAQAAVMLREYFRGQRKDFEGLPIRADGTAFQKRAWDALLKIPYGQTRSYKQQAETAGNIKACRAIGAANGKNPISIIIPCHRVIGSDKSLTGYGGGLEVKKALLDLEKKHLIPPGAACPI